MKITTLAAASVVAACALGLGFGTAANAATATANGDAHPAGTQSASADMPFTAYLRSVTTDAGGHHMTVAGTGTPGHTVLAQSLSSGEGAVATVGADGRWSAVVDYDMSLQNVVAQDYDADGSFVDEIVPGRISARSVATAAAKTTQSGSLAFGDAASTRFRTLAGTPSQLTLTAPGSAPKADSFGARVTPPAAGTTGPVTVGSQCLTNLFDGLPVSAQACTGAANQQFHLEAAPDGRGQVLEQGGKVLSASTRAADRQLTLKPFAAGSTTLLQHVTPNE